MVVLLPAPLGPTNPVTWPGRTVNDIPSKARCGPKRLRRPLTTMVLSVIEYSSPCLWGVLRGRLCQDGVVG